MHGGKLERRCHPLLPGKHRRADEPEYGHQAECGGQPLVGKTENRSHRNIGISTDGSILQMHNVAADPFRLVSGKAIGDIGAVLEDWQGELVAHQGDGVRCDDFVLRTCQRGGQRLVQVAYNDAPGIFIASLAGKYRGEEKHDYDDG